MKVVAFLPFLLLSAASTPDQLFRIPHACVEEFGAAEQGASTTWLLNELKGRGVRWNRCGEAPITNDESVARIRLGMNSSRCIDECGCVANVSGSFVVSSSSTPTATSPFVLSVAASDATGVLAGVRRLVRELSLPARNGRGGGDARAPANLCVAFDAAADARWKVRGHQIPVSHHALQFRSAAQFSQFADDLAVFGTTQLEAAHIASFDDPAPFDDDGGGDGGSLGGLVAFSSAVAGASLDVSLWWPSGLSNDASSLAAADEAFKEMPRVDALFMPGGDGGALDWATLEATAAVLRSHHPNAEILVSAQDLSSEGMEQFWANVTLAFEDYLSGVVYGPHCRVPLTEFIQRAAQAGKSAPIPVRDYPDITHTLSSQFPLSGWHSAWSLTHGRNPVMPLPRMMASLVELRSNASYGGGGEGWESASTTTTTTTPIPAGLLVGFGAYSEGIGDDLNKVIWSAMGEDRRLTVEDVVTQYCKYFFGADAAPAWEKVLWGLEQNWGGPFDQTRGGGGDVGLNTNANRDNGNASPGAANVAIPQTLQDARDAMGSLLPLLRNEDWRGQMYAKRAFYDAYVQARYVFEVEGNEAKAYAAFAAAPQTGSLPALGAAVAALRKELLPGGAQAGTFAAEGFEAKDLDATANRSVAELESAGGARYFRETTRLLAAALNESVGAEVVGNQDTSLGMSNLDAPISDAAWVLDEADAMLRSAAQTSEEERLAAIAATFTQWGDPGPGGFYDDLGGDACNFNIANAYAGNPGSSGRSQLASHGASSAAPRLVSGQGAGEDPAFYFTPLLAGPTTGGAAFLGSAGRMSWNCYAMTFFDAASAVELFYDGVLDPTATYQAKVVFNVQDEPGASPASKGGGGDGGSGSSTPNSSLMRLMANNRTTVWPTGDDDYQYPPVPLQVTIVDIPKQETESGSLRLSCSQYPGVSGNGRTCQISEVWLVPVNM